MQGKSNYFKGVMMSSEDEAPETVSLETSRARALATISSQQYAIKHQNGALKAQRRLRDTRNKEQRALRPLPETVIEEAFEHKKSRKQGSSVKIVFAREERNVPKEFHELDIVMLDEVKRQQQAAVKERHAQVESVRQQRLNSVVRVSGLLSLRRCLLKRRVK